MHVKTILENIFPTWGFPKSFKSDHGPPFNSLELTDFLNSLGIKHVRTPFWPEANGMAERFVKTVKNALLCTDLQN